MRLHIRLYTITCFLPVLAGQAVMQSFFYFIVIIGSVFGYTLRVFDFTNRVTAACCWEQLAAAAAAAALVRLSFFFVFVRYRLDVHVV